MDAIRIDCADVPAPSGVAQGYVLGDLVFLSGQSAADASGRLVGAGDFDAQVAEIMRKLDALLAAARSSRSRILKVTIYLADASHFAKLIDVRRRWFSPPYPADTVVEVARLSHPEAIIEIDVMALAGGGIVG